MGGSWCGLQLHPGQGSHSSEALLPLLLLGHPELLLLCWTEGRVTDDHSSRNLVSVLAQILSKLMFN